MTAKDPIPGIIVGLGSGVGVGAVTLVITFFLTFSICSDSSIAEKVFPFALIADPSLFERPFIALVLAALQFPFYGIVLGFIWAKAGETKVMFGMSIILLLVAHLAVGTIASRRVEKMWQQKFAEQRN
ncbi:MAG TPA: hypothetical protein VFX97_19305 [Pyrinomonadaceae bacterium]|nr:hypothetical protein [Pyrinomonadaceae bacterium]